MLTFVNTYLASTAQCKVKGLFNITHYLVGGIVPCSNFLFTKAEFYD
jgi:hypothetical protein